MFQVAHSQQSQEKQHLDASIGVLTLINFFLVHISERGGLIYMISDCHLVFADLPVVPHKIRGFLTKNIRTLSLPGMGWGMRWGM